MLFPITIRPNDRASVPARFRFHKWSVVVRSACPFLPLAALLLSGMLIRPVRGEDTFTLAVLPDVQMETSGTRFRDRLTWLVDNRSALNLKMMMQCGDMMNFNDEAQYKHQSDGLKVLDDAHLPYVTCIGNHDTAAVKVDAGSAAPGNVNANLRNTIRYNSHFPTTRFKLLAGTFEANKIDNASHIFTAGGLNWLVINLELWARSGAVDWAKTIVAKYPDYNVIFLTHAHLNGDSSIQQNNGGYGDNTPQYVFDQAMKPYANVRLVFSGHVGTHGYRTDTGTQGNTIYQFLQCYHDPTNNPTRLLQIDTKNGTIKTWVFNPSNNETRIDGSSRTITGIHWVQPASTAAAAPGKTTVSIAGEDFHINGQPTYAGRSWKGHRIEGLLLNSRMVQATFDDLNPETVKRWAYADTGKWDAERNLSEFIAAMPEWGRHGLLAVTVNLQGGSPEGYSANQPWESGAFTADGGLRPEFAARMRRVLDAADEQGMVVIIGYFYFGQSPRFAGDAAVIRGTDEATRWLLEGNWRNVLVEINNETNPDYQPPILRPDRVGELIQRVRAMKATDGHTLLVGTSFGGCVVPAPNIVAVSDFLLIHGNGADKPEAITELISKTRAVPTFKPMPVLINEDDHENFDKPDCNFSAAVAEHVSWGWFDFRRKGEGMEAGYQSPPVNWGISSDRKRAFFKVCTEITGTGNL